MSGKLSFHTFGCRMNACDTELLRAILGEGRESDCCGDYGADIIILNCCSVREDGHTAAFRAIDRVLEANPQTCFVVCGCYANLLDGALFADRPEVGAIVRPGAYRAMPDVVRRLRAGERHFVVGEPEHSAADLYEEVLPCRVEGLPNAAIAVGKGCNQNCSYCIEPYTRGRERYIAADTAVRNVDALLERGARAVTLVGHVVDRYRDADDTDFAALLRMLAPRCEAAGARLRYLSSHPLTYTADIVRAVAGNPAIEHIVHLPVQSGSNAVLHRMRRGYTVEQYMHTVRRTREICPDMAIVTDIMTGFCGETDADFEKSVRLVEELRPADINVYRFSMRPHTAAALLADDVAPEVKDERFRAMCALRDKLRQT